MPKEWSSRIKELERRAEDLERQTTEARRQLYAAMIEEAGVKVGDIVRGKGRSRYSGEIFRVCRVDPSSWRVWVEGNPCKKDGTFGTAKRLLFSEWEKVE